ncbi:hypothetical protein MED222_05315 [Vibrio sp. MED222]|nr:hypothetical protein MED222_05315 [Vibrio sp. MED222]
MIAYQAAQSGDSQQSRKLLVLEGSRRIYCV